MAPLFQKVARGLFRFIGKQPLPLVHFEGILVGWMVYAVSSLSKRNTSSANLLRKNLHLSGICDSPGQYRQILHSNIAETGKSLLETFAIWNRGEQSATVWVRECLGWEDVENAKAAGKGIIFLTPHLGCYEITSLYYATRYPITVLYRPPRKRWLMPLIEAGRSTGQVRLAPTNARGVRDLLQTLKQGEAIGILPDQIPGRGEGEWAPFFGRPAYTMTLVSRIAEKTGAPVFMVFGERLPWGRGYRLHFRPLPSGAVDSVAGMNRAVEDQIRRCPAQYQWNYHRYNIRKGTRPEGGMPTFEQSPEQPGN